ncbi:MAG: response regulator [Actinobacteria bacterium]|nr:response regulator [Actinomycetota bacterium]
MASTSPAPHARRGAMWPAAVVFVVLAALAVTGFGIARSATQREEANLLEQRASEVAAILSTSTSIATSMELIGEVYAGGAASTSAFRAGARSLVTGAVTGVGIARVVDDQVRLEAFEGTGATAGDVLTGPRAAVVRDALGADGLASTLVRGGARSTLVLAIGRDDGLVVLEETVLSNEPIESTPDSPFRALDAALYRTPTADPGNLLIATTADLPLDPPVDSRTLTFGSEQWLLQTSAHTPLASSAARAVPWIILVSGLIAALGNAVIVALLIRRRSYALSLVDQRTADLRAAVAELERAREAADGANKAKSQFLSRMSHELRTPLNAVLGFAQVLELSDLEPRDRDSVEHILKGGNHLLSLINEVIDISRVESGDISLSPESVLANELVTETLDLMRPLATARSIHIASDRRSTCLHYVFADRQRLKQILLNLLSNAVKYNRVGGTVAVTCEEVAGNRLRLKVTDTGAGIAPDDIRLLFVPFERLGANLTDVEGSGIGLALSKRLAEAMGGELGVESTVGTGSTFWVELPLVEGAVERYERLSATVAPHGHEPAPAAESAQHVLYIEDNLANITLVQRILADRGDIELVPAMQGRLGVDLAHQRRPDLILLDLHLPDIQGDEVLRQLRDDPATASIPVVVVSADATAGQVQRLQSAGAVAYLTKPFNVRELLQTIDEYLDASVRN